MPTLPTLLVLLSTTVSAQPPVKDVEVVPDQPRPQIVVDLPAQDPAIEEGLDEVVARSGLVGIWEGTYLEQRSDPRPALAAQMHVRFSRGKIELYQAGRTPTVVAYSLGVNHYPRHFDWYQYRGNEICLQRGVYSLEDDRLFLCLGPVNGRRATEFFTTPFDGRTMFAFKRLSSGDESPMPKLPR